MDDIRFVGRARAGIYTGLVLQQVGDGLCITATAAGMSEAEVSGALDMETREPLVNVQVDRPAARALQLWAERMGSTHLVDLLKEAVKDCPASVRETARIVVDDRGYTITRVPDGMRLQGQDADLTLMGPIVTRTNGERWLYVRWLAQPPRDGDR